MLTPIGFAILIIAILVYSLGKLVGFPSEWEWFDLILATVGIAMAMTGVFQSIAGRARLIAYFKLAAKDNQRELDILLKNPPVGERWGKFGVDRNSIQSLEISLRLLKANTKDILQSIIHAKILDHADGVWKNRITLPPTSSIGAAISVAFWDFTQETAMLLGDAQRDNYPLEKGQYQLILDFQINGESRFWPMNFVVGADADSIMWVLPNPDREDYRIR